MTDSTDSKRKVSSKAIKRLESKLTKEMLWIYILRLLLERPHYGYEIKELVVKRFNFAPATVSGYAILYRLKNDGLIDEQTKDDSPRKYYGITEKGRTAMIEAKEFLTKTMQTVFDFIE